MDRVVKPILMIACHNLAETMEFVMTRLPVTHANAHLVTPDFRAKQISMIANRHRAIEALVSMETTHLHANVIPDILVNFAKLKSMNANQVSTFSISFSFSGNSWWRLLFLINSFLVFLDPCQFEGHCEDLVGGYRCRCKPGTSGENCEVNVNECHSSK